MQTPEPDTGEAYYMVQVGPFNDRNRASDVAAQLALAGLSPRISSIQDTQRYEVISEVLPVSVAERRVEALAALGFRARVRLIGGEQAVLEFGVFVSEQNAEALARRIRSRGYYATVVREGGELYLIALGPYRQSTIETVIRTIRSRLGAVTVTTVPADPP